MSIRRSFIWTHLACVWLGLAAAAPALAQTVYRCGAGEYSQSPCPGGQALAVPAEPNAEQQRVAKTAAERDARLADQMKKDRLAREREAGQPRAINVGPERAHDKLAAKPAVKSAPASASAAASGKGKKSGQSKDRVKDESGRKASLEKRTAQGTGN